MNRIEIPEGCPNGGWCSSCPHGEYTGYLDGADKFHPKKEPDAKFKDFPQTFPVYKCKIGL